MENTKSLDESLEKLNALNEEGRYTEVLIEVEKQMLVDRNVSALWILQGNALNGLGRLEEALTAYQTAISIDPMSVEARCNYGTALFSLGRYVDALNAFDAAILTDSDFAPSYLNAAHCLIMLEHPEEAVFALDTAFNLDDSDAEVGLNAAALFALAGEYERARDLYFHVADLPDAPEDIHEQIKTFFEESKANGISRLTLMKDLDVWRTRFADHPKVFDLSKSVAF